MDNIHALIIDDDANNANILAQLLTWEGLSYTEILNSVEVENILPSIQNVDVIFLDLEMPDIDGYMVLEMLKLDDRLKTVPIVAYTVHFGEINNAQQVGFHSFLGKPLNIDLFPVQLARILSGEHVWAIA
jgi:CheY-like chemotaxis protein